MLQVEQGKRLKYLRLAKGLEQKHLAPIIGVNPNMISYYETGQRSMSTAVIGKLVAFFSATWAYFIEGDFDSLPHWLKGPVREVQLIEEMNPPKPRRRKR
jgi:transcriptional regulator with XRE-family HTH domain